MPFLRHLTYLFFNDGDILLSAVRWGVSGQAPRTLLRKADCDLPTFPVSWSTELPDPIPKPLEWHFYQTTWFLSILAKFKRVQTALMDGHEPSATAWTCKQVLGKQTGRVPTVLFGCAEAHPNLTVECEMQCHAGGTYLYLWVWGNTARRAELSFFVD